jgi:hypothetical protein
MIEMKKHIDICDAVYRSKNPENSLLKKVTLFKTNQIEREFERE